MTPLNHSVPAPLYSILLSGTLGPLGFQVMKGWLGPSLSGGKLRKLLNSSGPRIMVCQRAQLFVDGCSHFYAETAPTGASASSLLTCFMAVKLELHGGRAYSHVEDNVVQGQKSPTPPWWELPLRIKYHWPRWGSWELERQGREQKVGLTTESNLFISQNDNTVG